MSKLIYIQGEDNELLEVLMRALRDSGYDLQYGDVKSEETIGQLHADIALLCVPRTNEPAPLAFAGITIDEGQHRVFTEDGSLLHLTPTEFAVLRYLMEQHPKVVSRDELIPALWGFRNHGDTRVADDTVKRLRRKLQSTRLHIETVWGYGFKLTERPKEE